ncbi:pyruvate, water dikinase regulatory protein [Ureibacillus sinduriensis]|uniref:Putative pyruvate, phosphate dikinase regulatory protein n=1 Tax=Ureibacillus sinduriensis BLB-1 = JCM 15800 TaxID=1384057 RepID=A0A0A3II53_9BACL|nr:pyruvate, water dikinase regulatory protein [Ureibacillus sinduriensis]KGR74542.1 phosphotransferase [Ureibacillus sinduriensis BLB-1 = JCM 15800]
MKNLKVFVVSDSVGETGEQVVKAAVSQFRPTFDNTVIRKFPNIENNDHIEKIVEIAIEQDAIIVFTLVEKKMRNYMIDSCNRENIQWIDLLGPLIHLFEEKIGEQPREEPGLVHKLDADYFKKIEAVEFAVKYDDGRDPRGLLLADVVLVGVSRTSKTPLSQYLAHKRYKVANVPLVPEVNPPEELFLVDPKKCFGLVISTEKLNVIRKERLMALGLNDDAIYAKPSRIEQELEHFNKVVERIGCSIIDVTNKAVEETANVIMEVIEQSK